MNNGAKVERLYQTKAYGVKLPSYWRKLNLNP